MANTTYSKYKAQKVVIDGHKFDSKHEGKRYCELKLLEKAGKISELNFQVPFKIVDKSKYGRELFYIADFTYYEGGQFIVEDTKSKATRTPVYRLKKRLVAERYGITIKEVL